MSMKLISVEVQDPQVKESTANGGSPLRDLCRKEVADFDQYLRSCGFTQYQEGLARWERLAIEGYLYQKIRGHLDEPFEENDKVSDEDRKNG